MMYERAKNEVGPNMRTLSMVSSWVTGRRSAAVVPLNENLSCVNCKDFTAAQRTTKTQDQSSCHSVGFDPNG